MTTTRIYFVRHGESVSNAGGITMPHADIPLTKRGQEQAMAVADQLPAKPSRVLSSSFLRARETARPYCERVGIAVEVQPLLNEFSALDPAMLEGMNGAQRRPIANAYWAAADVAVRMGRQAETFLEFDARVHAFLRELSTLPDASVLFGHGIWFGLLCWRLAGRDDPDMRAFRRFQQDMFVGNGSVYLLSSTVDGRWDNGHGN
jgi:alpha-ribazole phosphatase